MLYVYLVVLIGAIAYGGICGLLYVKQRDLLYFPTPDVKLANNEHITLLNSQQSLKIWLLNKAKSRAIIYFGGNAEGVEVNISLYKDLFPEYTVYLVNYRGYGGSSGHPSEKAIFSDALHLYDHIKEQHSSVALIGRSLGSGVATYLAANRKIERMVLVTPYDSIVNVAQHTYTMLPVSWLLQDRYDSAAVAAKVSAATLLIMAEHDEMIPRSSSETLAAAFPADIISTSVIADHDHNSLSTDPEYNKILVNFINRQ